MLIWFQAELRTGDASGALSEEGVTNGGLEELKASLRRLSTEFLTAEVPPVSMEVCALLCRASEAER